MPGWFKSTGRTDGLGPLQVSVFQDQGAPCRAHCLSTALITVVTRVKVLGAGKPDASEGSACLCALRRW